MDFENLSHSLYDVWSHCGRTTNNYLSQAQLELVCEQVGLHARIARKVAEEVFEKLGLNHTADSQADAVAARVSFADFIALIQSDSADNSSAPMQLGGGDVATTPSALLLSTFTATVAAAPGTTAAAATTAAGAATTPRSDGAEDGEFVSCGTADSGLNTSKDSSGSASLLTVGQAGLCGPLVYCVEEEEVF